MRHDLHMIRKSTYIGIGDGLKEMLDQILDAIFADTPASIRKKLKRRKLEKALDRLANRFAFLWSKSPDEFPEVDISAVSATFLTAVNGKLEDIEDEKEKALLEHIIVDIAVYILAEYIRQCDQSMKDVLAQVHKGLKEACQQGGYDYEALCELIGLESVPLTAKKKVQRSPAQTKATPCWYKWNGEEEDLRQFARDMVGRKIFKSSKEFRSLFCKHEGNIVVRVAKKDLELVIVLFDEFKARKLISMKGNKGHFHPIRLYAVDFAGDVLIEKEPKHLKFTIAKNRQKHENLRRRVGKWIGHIEARR